MTPAGTGITITASSGLSDNEINRMKQDAEAHAEEDLRRKKLIETRNNAENLVYSAEKVLKDLGDKVPSDVKTTVEDRISKVRELLNSNDADSIQRAADDLSQELQKVGAAAYQEPSQGSAPGGQDSGQGGGTPGGDEDVVDGEFRNA